MASILRLLLALVTFIPIFSYAAFNLDFVGAESAGMGGTTAVETSLGGMMVNPTALSSIRSQQITISGINLYPGLQRGLIIRSLAGYANVRSGVGVGVVWGYLNAADLYSENVLTIAMTRTFKRITLGSTISVMEWDVSPTTGPGGTIIEDINGPTVFSLGLGIRFDPSPNVYLTASLLNLNRPNVASTVSGTSERLPLIGKLSVAVSSDRGRWGIGLTFRETEIDVRTGFERKLGERISLRAGFRLENLAMGINLTGGIGYRMSDSIRVNYALIYPMINLQGGMWSHCASVVYDF
jgi:hypothetical protein